MPPHHTPLPVTWNRFLAVVEEQGQTLVRATVSPIVRECRIMSAGNFVIQGLVLVQALTGTPGHINAMAEEVKSLLAHFAVDQMRSGDIDMTNDPWLASGHLDDFLLLMPVFRDGRVVGFTSCTSYLLDLGGRGRGPEGSDIHDEGLLIPPCKPVDCHEKPLELRAAPTVSPTGLNFDLAFTSGCSSEGLNVPLSHATTYAVFALRCLIGPDIPNNAEIAGPFRGHRPARLHPDRPAPAPVAMRHRLGQMTPDLVLGCRLQAMPGQAPAEGASGMYDLPPRHAQDAVRKRPGPAGGNSRWNWSIAAAPARRRCQTGCR